MVSKQAWGRRKSDNQPYPKTIEKETLPTGLRIASRSHKRMGQRRYDVPYRWVLPSGRTHKGMGHVRAESRDEAVGKTTDWLEKMHPTAKIRIYRDRIRTRKLTRAEKKNNPCPEKKR